MQTDISPRLTLIGAGPGDPELITLKGLKALQDADVILYDSLANQELLAHAKSGSEKIYVGKKGHEKGITQAEINQLIVDKAFEKGHVARLKGGDPFVFGRGTEELKIAAENQIPFSYIPGISSVMTPGLHHIPLTDRNYSDGFWVITGHKSDLSLSEDLNLAAKSKSTVVLLMAMTKLSEISRIFAAEGKGDTPAAIISKASTKFERIVFGTAAELSEMAVLNNLKNPSIVILGGVVNIPANLKAIADTVVLSQK
jgi:uroporphyrin-III C-methyltransferase